MINVFNVKEKKMIKKHVNKKKKNVKKVKVEHNLRMNEIPAQDLIIDQKRVLFC